MPIPVLVWFDISDPANPQLAGRLENAFPESLPVIDNNYSYDYSMVYGEKKSGIIVGRALKEREEDIVRHGNWWGWGAEYAIADAASPSMSAGATGSMSRFALYDKYLYAVINYRMCIFDLSEPEPVNKGSTGAGNVAMC